MYQVHYEAAVVLQKHYRAYKAKKLVDLEFERWLITWKWDKFGKHVSVIGDFTDPPWKSQFRMQYDWTFKYGIFIYVKIMCLYTLCIHYLT